MKSALIKMAPAPVAMAIAAALAAPALAAPPATEDDHMAVFFGNTLEVSVPAVHYYLRRYIDPDGTWREPRGDGFVRGAWERTQDGGTCHWQTDPPLQDAARYCYPPVTRKVGDRWTSIDPNSGNEVIQEIVAGRE